MLKGYEYKVYSLITGIQLIPENDDEYYVNIAIEDGKKEQFEVVAKLREKYKRLCHEEIAIIIENTWTVDDDLKGEYKEC